MKKRTKIVGLFIPFILLAVVLVNIFTSNSKLECNTYQILSDRLPKEFDGYKIAHISDLHNTENQSLQNQLLQALETAKPDMIAITGDLIDSRNTNIDVALQFVEKAVQIAPCYFVAGNHEGRIAQYDTLETGLRALGVIVLKDALCSIDKGESSITLIGMQDPIFWTDDAGYIVNTKLFNLTENVTEYTVLLSHRPELFDYYGYNGIDLALTGHAHGGQIRLPWLGGIFAPHQGFFPKYDSGLFAENNTTMVVSRGIGNSLFPFRVNNRPELIIIELSSSKEYAQ